MADPKEPQLNGAYYGPPVPPQQHPSYNNNRTRRGCGCLCNLFKLLISITIILGIAVLALWLVFRPNEIKAYVDSASLTHFNLSDPTNNLQYNLTLDMSIRNPNRRIGLYYDYIEAQALYDGSRFGFTQLPTFYQGHKTTSVLGPVVFSGQGLVFGDSVATTYKREKGEGFYFVEVKLYTRMRLKVFFLKVRVWPEIDCVIRLPVPGSTGTFERTRCDVDF